MNSTGDEVNHALCMHACPCIVKRCVFKSRPELLSQLHERNNYNIPRCDQENRSAYIKALQVRGQISQQVDR